MFKNNVTKNITDEIKKTLVGFDQKKMLDQMMKHYKILHLMDDDGKWASPEFAKISSELLPENFTEQKSKAFVDNMGMVAEKNPYLMHFFDEIINEKFPELSKKVQMEGKDVFPDVVALSNVYECLTKAMYNDPKLLEICIDIFDKERKKTNSLKNMSLFHKVKFASVDYPIKNIVVNTHKKGAVDPKATRFFLPLNILEASLADFITGHNKNALTGITLAKNRPGAKEVDTRTGEGPTKLADDKKAIEVSAPLPRKWADLYQSWNMAFMSQAGLFPYYLPKLSIPQVADYQKKPKEYMYNRIIALYLFLNYSEFEYIKKTKDQEPYIDWSDKKLTDMWGKSNNECSIKYSKALDTVKKCHTLETKNKKIHSRNIKMPVAKKPLIQKSTPDREPSYSML